MTSKIKVDNINKVSDDSNIIKKCGTTTTIGSGASNPIVVDGSAITLGRCGGTVALASGATQTGFGRTGTVDWDTTPKTATFTAVSGDGFFANTTGSAFNMNLPAGVVGAIVSVADYAATFQTNNLTVVPNGTDKIGSLNENAVLSTQGQSVTFVYVDSTQGWINTMDSTSNVRGQAPFISATGGTITTVGNDKIHTFTGPGTFAVSSISACAANNVVSYLIVAGGGGGGSCCAGGGGGAGGFREVESPVTPYTASPLDGYGTPGNRITATVASFPIVVGAGGAGGIDANPNNSTSGGVSSYGGITAAGGGRGSSGNCNAESGGSGGGGAHGNPNTGTGNTPPTTPSQGSNGGSRQSPVAPDDRGGGGGGAAEAGNVDGMSQGGDGVETSINNSATFYAGGGGGGTRQSCGGSCNPGPKPGGSGGGGAGGGTQPYPRPASDAAGTAGTVNTGGGGGAGTRATPGSGNAGVGGAGGSGVVIIRYKFQ